MTYDPRAAEEKAVAAIEDRLKRIVERARRESDVAAALAAIYARHLADGGSPLEGFELETSRELHASLIRPTAALDGVYRDWDEARGSRNPFSPISEPKEWQVAEYALARLGQPMHYSVLREVPTFRGRSYNGSLSSDEVATTLAKLQGDDLVLRRTKVGGKVAYLLRERREGEERVGRFHDDGRVRLFAVDVPEEKWTP